MPFSKVLEPKSEKTIIEGPKVSLKVVTSMKWSSLPGKESPGIRLLVLMSFDLKS